MGHIRYGRLPKTVPFKRVSEMLGDELSSPEAVSIQTLKAAQDAFDIASHDPALHYTYWLLTQIAWNSRDQKRFEAFLKAQNIPVDKSQSALKLISCLAEKARNEASGLGSNSIFGDMAQMAMREVLTERLVHKTDLLFGSTTEDVRLSLKELSTQKQFGHVSKRYFGNILSRMLKYYLNKDLSNHVGPKERFSGIQAANKFEERVDSFSYQSAEIAERFAGDWYSKRNYIGDISFEDSRGFIHVALNKLKKELALEAKDLAQ